MVFYFLLGLCVLRHDNKGKGENAKRIRTIHSCDIISYGLLCRSSIDILHW